MSRFDFTLKHVAGKSMGRADSLSRRVDWAEGVEQDNENQVMLKEEWLEVRAMEQLIEGLEHKCFLALLIFIKSLSIGF